MYGSLNPQRSVVIKEHKRCCRSKQFNSNFPQQLTGIIHPDEFYQSIDNINHACKMTFIEKMMYFISYLCLLIGLVIFIIGKALVSIPNMAVWIALMFAGGGISIVIISCWISPSRRARLIHAINVESMKYTTRRPIPPRWRLSVYTYTTHDAGGTQNIHVIYSIIIDIGKSGDSEMRSDALNLNRNLHEPTSYIGQQYRPMFSLSHQNLSVINSHDQSLFNEEQAHIHSPV